MAFYSNDLHFTYLKVNRHWSPISEQYAGGDALFTALSQDWEPADTVYNEERWQAGARQISIFHFELHRDGEVMHMPVLCNPYVRRLVDEMDVILMPHEDRTAVRPRTRKV